jgi:hypothetical protein
MTPIRPVHPARYRVYQFFAALRAYLPAWTGGYRGPLAPADEAMARSILTTPAQHALFTRMPPNDRRHALAVARTLQRAGHSNPALLQAALLHDAAKSLGQSIPHRVLIVLLQAFGPGLLRRLAGAAGADHLPWWQRPFAVHAHHPALGAAWAREAGCHPQAVGLIARHEEKTADTDPLLAALRWADNLN